MSPPGYQAPVMKASRCGNERQERSGRRKEGRKGSGKKISMNRFNSSVSAISNFRKVSTFQRPLNFSSSYNCTVTTGYAPFVAKTNCNCYKNGIPTTTTTPPTTTLHPQSNYILMLCKNIIRTVLKLSIGSILAKIFIGDSAFSLAVAPRTSLAGLPARVTDLP